MKKIRNRKDLQITDLLIAHGPAGYGVYVMLTQYLSERKSLRRREDIARIAYELHAPAEMVRSVLEDFGLFTLTDEGEFANESPAPRQPKEQPQEECLCPEAPLPHKPEPEPEPKPAPKTAHKPAPKLKGKIPVKKLLRAKKRPNHSSSCRKDEKLVSLSQNFTDCEQTNDKEDLSGRGMLLGDRASVFPC